MATVQDSNSTAPARKDPRPNRDVYARSRRAELAGLDPNYHYQLCNAIPTSPGKLSEVEEKLQGKEFGYEGVGFIETQWEVVGKDAAAKMQGARKRDDDAQGNGVDTAYRTGGQVLMRIPRETWEIMEDLDKRQQKRIEARLSSKQAQTVGSSSVSATTQYGDNATVDQARAVIGT